MRIFRLRNDKGYTSVWFLMDEMTIADIEKLVERFTHNYTEFKNYQLEYREV